MIDLERYLILIEGGPPSNFSAWSPDVPGCVATGDTVDGCLDAMRSALGLHIESLETHGEAAPSASGPGVYLERVAAA